MSSSLQPLYIDPSLPVSEAFNELPPGFKIFLKNGFSILTKAVKAGKTTEFVKTVIENGITAGTPTSRSAAVEIAKQLSVKVDDVHKLLAAVAFSTSTVVAQQSLSSDDFVQAGVRAGFIDADEQYLARQFIEALVQSRIPIVEINEKSRVASRLLPSLTTFSTVVDVRPAFNDDDSAVRFSVPVVIAHIENDSTNDGIWLQMSKRQVQNLIADLQLVLTRIDIIEKWSAEKA